MAETIATVALALAVAGLLVYVLWWQVHDPAPSTRRRPERPTVCAWCVYRDGDDCTHPGSPVGQGGACGPVCVGRLPCKVREVRR